MFWIFFAFLEYEALKQLQLTSLQAFGIGSSEILNITAKNDNDSWYLFKEESSAVFSQNINRDDLRDPRRHDNGKMNPTNNFSKFSQN